MARLKTTGPLSLREVINFFGAGDSLADFRRGAGIVPNIPENSGVPTGFPISLRQLLGVYDAPSYTPISVTANHVTESGTFAPVTGSSTRTVSGGDGSYTTLWTLVSGEALLSGANTGSSASFSTSSMGTHTAVYRVTVNDGISSDSFDINVSLTLGDPV